MAIEREYRIQEWNAREDQLRNGMKFKAGETTFLSITNSPVETKSMSADEKNEKCVVILPINPLTNFDEQIKLAHSIKDYLNKIQEAKERAVNAAQLGFLK